MFSKTDVETYFNGEKSAAIVFMIIGAVAIAAAVLLFFGTRTPLAKGIAIPLMLIGCIQFVVGYTVHSRVDKQRTDIVYAMDMNPDVIQQKEIPRMQTVMKRFVDYRYAEIAFMVAGIVLWLLFRQADDTIWKGVGIGLLLQATISLCADFFAEQRGAKYLNGLQGHQQQKS